MGLLFTLKCKGAVESGDFDQRLLPAPNLQKMLAKEERMIFPPFKTVAPQRPRLDETSGREMLLAHVKQWAHVPIFLGLTPCGPHEFNQIAHQPRLGCIATLPVPRSGFGEPSLWTLHGDS